MKAVGNLMTVLVLSTALQGCMSPLMSENPTDRIAAVDTIQSEKQLAMIALDCGFWGPSCEYPLDVRLRAIDRLADSEYLPFVALFKVDSRYSCDRHWKASLVFDAPDSAIRDHAFSKMMSGTQLEKMRSICANGRPDWYWIMDSSSSEKALPLFVSFDHDRCNIIKGSDERQKSSYTSSFLWMKLGDAFIDSWAKYAVDNGHGNAVAECLAECMKSSRSTVDNRLLQSFQMSADNLRVLRDRLKEKRDSRNPNKCFEALARKVKTGEEAHILLSCVGFDDRNQWYKSSPYYGAVWKNLTKLAIEENDSLLRSGRLEEFKRNMAEAPVLSPSYFSKDILAKYKRDNRAREFVDAIPSVSPGSEGLKLFSAVSMGCLSYVKENRKSIWSDFERTSNGFARRTYIHAGPDYSGCNLLELSLCLKDYEMAEFLFKDAELVPRVERLVEHAADVAGNVDWCVKQKAECRGEKITPDSAFEKALDMGKVAAAELIRKHFNLSVTNRVDEYVVGRIKRTGFAISGVDTYENVTHAQTYVDAVRNAVGYLVSTAKCPTKSADGKISALANLADQLTREAAERGNILKNNPEMKTGLMLKSLADMRSDKTDTDEAGIVRLKMIRAALQAMIESGVNLDAEIVTNELTSESLDKIDAVCREYEDSPVLFLNGGYRRFGENGLTPSNSLLNKLRNAERECAKARREMGRAKRRKEEVFNFGDSFEEALSADGYESGVRSRVRACEAKIRSILVDILKESNELDFITVRTPVLFRLATANEISLSELMIQNGVTLPCVKRIGEMKVDLLTTLRKIGQSRLAVELERAIRSRSGNGDK